MFLRIVFFVLLLGANLIGSESRANYLIQAGDQLAVEILEDATLNRNLLVLPDGRVSFPMAGSVKVAGKTTSQVERSITSTIASNFSVTPTVFVSVVGLAPEEEEEDTVVVYLLGEVNAPGPKAVLPGTTLLQLLSQSGGFSKFAATKRLQLRRKDDSGRQRLYKINYRAISQGASLTSDPTLVEGDVILVPERRLFE